MLMGRIIFAQLDVQVGEGLGWQGLRRRHCFIFTLLEL
jgi:hypothetical protein